MTDQNELQWNHAIECEDYELAKEVEASAETSVVTQHKKLRDFSGAIATQRAILDSELYWGTFRSTLQEWGDPN